MTSNHLLGQHANHPTMSVGLRWVFKSHTLYMRRWCDLLSRIPWRLTPRTIALLTLWFSTIFFVFLASAVFLASVSASEPKSHETVLRVSVDTLPARLNGVSAKSDWGLHETCQLTLQIENESPKVWNSVTADGGCTCLKIDINEIPESGIAPGESIFANLVYSKPKEPGLSPRSIQFTINESPVVLPVLVDWYAPIGLRKLEQVKPDTWRVTGYAVNGWKIETIESVASDVKIEATTISDRTFVVDLVSDVKVARSCWLRCNAVCSSQSIEQVLTVSLESSEPRSIPSRLICQLDDDGVLAGETRLFFPRARITERPNLSSSELVRSDGSTLQLSVTQKSLGKTAFKVNFASTTGVTRGDLNESSRIRFLFDDDTKLTCPILISTK